MSATLYRILSAAGEKREDGQADVEVAGGALVLAPAGESVLRIPFGQIASVTEPEPFMVRITLAGGDAIELSRLGRDADAAARRAARRPGGRRGGGRGRGGRGGGLLRGSGGEPAEVRVYDDALLVIGAAARSGSASPSPARCGCRTTPSPSTWPAGSR